MKNLVILPTYNERGNILRLIGALLATGQKHKIPLDILVVDDASPDGTGKLVAGLKKKNHRLHLIQRPGKLGIGTAIIEAFQFGLSRGAKNFITMDADFSHHPKYLASIIQKSQEADLVIGSRWLPGGGVVGWGWTRYYLYSRLPNIFVRLILGLKPHDNTSGYRCYSRRLLKTVNFKTILSSGYAFQAEMALRAQNKGLKIAEVPIVYVDRRVGKSKIAGELPKSAKIVWRLAMGRPLFRQFIKFSLVGATCTVIDWSVFFGVKLLTGWQTQNLKQVIKGISFAMAVIVSYILNRTWTFRSKEPAILEQATRFLAAGLVGLGLNNLIFYLVTGLWHWRDVWGLVVATGLVLFWNFSINRLWVFRQNAKVNPPAGGQNAKLR